MAVRGWEEVKGWIGRARRILGHWNHSAWYVMVDTHHYTFVQTHKMDVNPVWSMGCGWRRWVNVGLLIVVYEPLQRRMLAWGGWACWGRDAHEFSVPSTQSCCELKAALIKPILKKPRHIMKDAAYFSYSGPQKFIITTGRIFQFCSLILRCLQANSKHVTVLSMHEHQYVGVSSPCPSFMWEYTGRA